MKLDDKGMPVFEGEDFEKSFNPPLGDGDREFIAQDATATLHAWLKEQPIIYCRDDNGLWAADQSPDFSRATHDASLVGIRKMDDGKCPARHIITRAIAVRLSLRNCAKRTRR